MLLQALLLLLGISSCQGQSLTVDATYTIGTSSSTFNLAAGALSDSTLEVFQVTPTITSGMNLACQVSCNTGGDVSVFIKYGSVPTIASLGDGSTTAGCPASHSLQASADQTAYVTINADAGLSSGFIQCTSTAPTAAPTAAPTCSCFADQSTVEVQGKGTVTMEDLQANDRVLVGSKGNKPLYQTVYAFGHLDRDTPTDYIRIHTNQDNEPLEISTAHLIFLEGQKDPVRADTIQKGNVLVQTTLDAPTEGAIVTKIEKVTRKGAYMPLTKDGFIVVNGILASAYVSIMGEAPHLVDRYLGVFSEHQLVHSWLAPYRLLCLGLSSGLCHDDYNEEGIAYWLVFGRALAREANSWGAVGQCLGLLVVGLFLAIFMVLEAVLDWLGSSNSACSGVVLLLPFVVVALGSGKERLEKKKIE